MPSARFMYEVLAAALLCLLRALIATAEYDTSRNGLGVLDCFGQTCSFGQFCSQSRLYRSCRSCDDITEWCDANKTHMAYVFPTCFYLCERKEKERLQAEVEGRQPLDTFHIILITMVVVLAASHAVVPLLRCFKRKKEQRQGQITHSQNDVWPDSNSDIESVPDTVTDPNSPLLMGVVIDGSPESPLPTDNDTTTDLKTPCLQTAPDPEEHQERRLPRSSAVDPDDNVSNTSDLATSTDGDTTTTVDDDDDDRGNDNDSGVMVQGQEQGQVGRASSSEKPELQLPVQIRDGITNYPIKTTDVLEKAHLVATGRDNIDPDEHVL